MPRPGDLKNFGALSEYKPSLHPQNVDGGSDVQGDAVDAEGAVGLVAIVQQGAASTGSDSAFYLEESEDGSSDWSKVDGSDLLLDSDDSLAAYYHNAEEGDGHYRIVYDSGDSDADVEVSGCIVYRKLEGLSSDDA